MTTTTPQAERFEITPVAFDLYRDIHKGIRAELFAATAEAGRLDPADDDACAALSTQVGSTVDLLVSHAEHEDRHIQPSIEEHLPVLGSRIAADHHELEARMEALRALGSATVTASAGERRFAVHRCYLELAAFTSAYLAHIDLEERSVMPQLFAAIGFEVTVEIHQIIIGSLPPDEMAASLAVMLPAMNLDDRTELLGGVKEGAPPEVFTGVWSLAGSVLEPSDHRAVAARLGLG